MKLAPEVVFLFRDSEGFGSAIADGLHLSPGSSAQRVEQPFELPFDRYGIRDQMTRGLVVNFIDNGIHHVSMVLLDNYETPILACAVQKHTSRAVAAKTDKAPSSLQIHYEPLACLLQLVNVLKLPTSILIGRRSQSFSDKALSEDLETFYKIGELLEGTTSLCFSKDMISWNPSKSSKDGEESRRAVIWLNPRTLWLCYIFLDIVGSSTLVDRFTKVKLSN
ncbi:hypothetical protein SLA2020_506190 [Shorea laevis]